MRDPNQEYVSLSWSPQLKKHRVVTERITMGNKSCT